MPTNDIKPFAAAGGANVLTQAEYLALAALSTGFSSGKANSKEVNKAIRQATFIASVLAQFICDKSGSDVLDDGNVAGLVTNLLSAINKTSQPLDATLTALAGLVGAANKLPYFNGADTAALTDLTKVGRDIIGKSDIAAVLQYLGLDTALAAKQPLSTQLTYFANHSDTEILQYLGVPSVISAAISSLVDSSPAALDTLNELAEALGNDPNFSTTVLNKLAGKQPLDATLTGLSGKNDAGLRAYLSLKSAATRDVGSLNGQLPGMDLFASTIAGTGEKALPDSSTGTGMFILKWGAIAAPTAIQDITTLFQTPFPNKCLRVFAIADYEPGTGNVMYVSVNNSTLQRDRFIARFSGSANYTSGVYFALGY
ncbi:hypothetical protein I6M76_01315 [Citrobacter cronae]|uniref:gp53-like domain-containing protein n=1 Tax=Citrobacter cronae TaxID=1748967 RepID=UPI0018FF5BC3|nr:hypothetical protein [Citrobacter cronae]MBJ8361242.1 hypothetical protein [Citrobacter cronae]